MAVAATVLIKLQADIAQFVSGMSKANNSLMGISKAMSTIRSAALVSLAHSAIQAANEIDNFARSVSSSLNDLSRFAEISGMAVDEFQKWKYAAKMSDVDLESLARGFKILSTNMMEGDKAFETLGVSIRDAQSGSFRPLSDVMKDLMDRFASYQDGASKSAMATKLWGRSGNELIPFLNKGSIGFNELAEAARKLGIIIDPDLVRAGSKLEDELKTIDARIEASKAKLIPYVALWGQLKEAMYSVLAIPIEVLGGNLGKGFKEAYNSTDLFTQGIYDALDALEKLKEGTQEVRYLRAGIKTPMPIPADENALKKAKSDIETRLKLEQEFRIKLLQLDGTTLKERLDILDIEEKGLLAGEHAIGKARQAIMDFYGAARIQAAQDEAIKIAEAYSKMAYEAPPGMEKWMEDGIEAIYNQRKGVLDLEMEYAELTGVLEDQLRISKELEDANIDRLTREGKLTSNLADLMRKVGDEQRRQKKVASEAEFYKYPSYETPMEEDWITNAKDTLRKQADAIRDVRKEYAQLIGDTRQLISINKEEEDSFISMMQEKFFYTEEWAKKTRELGDLKRLKMELAPIENFISGVGNLWSNVFANMIDGTESFKDVFIKSFKALADSAIQEMIRMATEWLKMQAIMGIGKLLGGVGMAALGGGGGGWSAGTMAAFNFGPSYMGAKGGIFTKPTRAVIGEAGPEAVIPLSDKKALGGGDTYVYINAVDTQSFDDAIRRNPGSILKVIHKDERENIYARQ